MKNRLLMVLLGFTALLAAPVVADAGEGPQLYRLTSDSWIEHVTQIVGGPATVQSNRLSGYIRLSPVVGPLDWNVFQILDAVLSEPDSPGSALGMIGSGYYRRGGRTGDQQSMTLSWVVDGVSWDLDSGVVQIVETWPELRITLGASHSFGDGSQKLFVRLSAVPAVPGTRYRLLEGSTLLDDCPICDRLSRPLPLRGEFDLVPVSSNSFSTRYHLFDVKLTATDGNGLVYLAEGEGDYTVGGEVAISQELMLNVLVKGGGHDSKSTTFTNSVGPPGRLWPMLGVDLAETKGAPAQTYSLQLRAAPVRELWFTTSRSLNPAINSGLPLEIVAGDVLSDQGRIVKSNADLLVALGAPAGTGPIAIDALDVVPGGTLLFSLGKDLATTSLGAVSEGDLVSDAGKIVKRNHDLTARLGIMPIVSDEGLDAVQAMEDGEIYFSTRRDDFSETLGPLSRGDLLSDQGKVVKTNQEMLKQFHPAGPAPGYGLDAFHVWPSGEVWFSTEEGFNDSVLGPIADGDLLSDQGYIVARNAEMVAKFQPFGAITNYGLASLFIVTDLLPAATGAPMMLHGTFDESGNPLLRWDAPGRCCQVESANTPLGPFLPASPILTSRSWSGTRTNVEESVFYRVRQW
jgi:hypothetical protein